MTPAQFKAALIKQSNLAWIIDNKFVTETGQPIEFHNHRFLIDYLADNHPHKTSKKSSQIGETVCELLDDFHLVGLREMNVIHTMHTGDVLQGFVRPKVNPLILNNPAIRAMMTIDSEGLKGFGKNFLYLRGANAESQAISISADVLKIDEKDRSNPTVVEMFQSRLDFSKYKWVREFSNPSAVGYGVDATYANSDQRHWFVKCHHCGHFSYMDWERSPAVDPAPHYVDRVNLIFACGGCGKDLSDADRINGEWVRKYQDRDKIHGYWFSQMMAPWFTAAEIAHKFETTSIEFFHNFVLGKAYTPSDLRLDRETILRANRPGTPVLRNVVMGMDVGKPHWVWIGNQTGVFRMGRVETWEEAERLFLEYKCEAWVMDSMPEFTKVQEMIRKYSGKVWACRFVKDINQTGIVKFQTGDKRGFVYADRTKVIDRVVNELAGGDIRLMMRPDELEEFITQAANIYRTVETNDDGVVKVTWRTQGDDSNKKPDHLVFAGVYWRIALEQSFGGGGVTNVSDDQGGLPPVAPTVVDGHIKGQVDVKASLDRAKR